MHETWLSVFQVPWQAADQFPGESAQGDTSGRVWSGHNYHLRPSSYSTPWPRPKFQVTHWSYSYRIKLWVDFVFDLVFHEHNKGRTHKTFLWIIYISWLNDKRPNILTHIFPWYWQNSKLFAVNAELYLHLFVCYSNRPYCKIFHLTNKGRRHQQLVWSMDGFSPIAKAKKEMQSYNPLDMKYKVRLGLSFQTIGM